MTNPTANDLPPIPFGRWRHDDHRAQWVAEYFARGEWLPFFYVTDEFLHDAANAMDLVRQQVHEILNSAAMAGRPAPT